MFEKEFFRQPVCYDVWNQKYRNGKESVEDYFYRQAQALSTSDEETATFFNLLSNQMINLGGRVQYALGTGFENQTMSNCYVVKIAKDSIDAIMKAQTEFVKTMKAGGGVGCNFSILRPKGAEIKKTNGHTSGVVEFLKGFNAWCGTISAGNNRRGAMMAVLDIWHPEIIDFIKAKQTKGVLDKFNLSVAISDEFMTAVEDDRDWDLIFPDMSYMCYDEEWDGNIKSWMAKGFPTIIYKTVPARELYDMIMKANYNYAEPGVLFIDTINRNNPLYKQEYINCTNPCGEQPLPPYGSCNLGAINLSEFVVVPFQEKQDNLYLEKIHFGYLSKAIKNAVIMLNRVLDLNYYPLDEYKTEVVNKRPIGLGIMGFGSMLNQLKIAYGSPESYHIADVLGETLLDEAYRASAELAKIEGAYPLFDLGDFKTSSVWHKLSSDTQDLIESFGLRNSKLLTVAPTGSTAIVAQNVSGGIEPLFALEYDRKIREEGDNYRTQKVADYSWWLYQNEYGRIPTSDAPDFFKATATNITPEQHIEMQATWQYWIDASISKTINVPSDIDFERFKNIYKLAWHKNLKGCTAYRPNDIVGSILSTEESTKDLSKQFDIENFNQQNYLYELELKDREPAIRERVLWKNKSKVYIVITITEDGYPIEIFTKLPKDAGNGLHQFEKDQFFEYVSNWDAICREASTLLRYGIPLEEIIQQLDKSAYGMFDCPAILARLLKSYPINVTITVYDDEVSKEDIVDMETNTSFIDKSTRCPECGGDLILASGCKNCVICGYSKCD